MSSFERVHTVHDWWDGPRAGFADFRGVPHAYRSIFREDLDDWDPQNRFYLRPISAATFELVLEDWAIWVRWVEMYSAGETALTTHPALPSDAARHEVLAPLLEQAMEVDGVNGILAEGEFRTAGEKTLLRAAPPARRALEVRWRLVE